MECAENTSDFVCRTTSTSIDKDKKLHYTIIDRLASRLNDKDVFFSDTRQDLHTCLTLIKLVSSCRTQRASRNVHWQIWSALQGLDPCQDLYISEW